MDAERAAPSSAALQQHRRSSAERAEAADVCRSGEWSFTCRPLLRVSHTWVLERRALLGCEWTLFTSRKFASAQDEDVRWTISLEADYPLGKTLAPPDLVRVCVAFSTRFPHKRVHFRALLRAQQEALCPDADLGVERALPLPALPDDLAAMTRADPNQRQHVGDLFVLDSDRALTVRVDIVYLADTQEARAGPPSVSLRVPPCSLADDMEALLTDVRFARSADTVLVADGREWRVHRAILCARSPVFAAMFEHDMAESKSNRVTIREVAADVLHQVLRYMYTGRVDHIKALGVDMLAVADRYALTRLKALCEEELASCVEPDNALDVLVTADLYAARELRDAALQCVCANIHQVLPSAAWQEVVRTRPHLLHQVLAKCVNYPID